jgi:hypothetical protein
VRPDWSELNLQTATLTVAEAKTEAGEGRVADLSIGLVEVEELATWKARSERTGRSEPVFPTAGETG